MAAGDIIVQHGSITFGASADTATATITAVGSTSSAFVLCCGVINTSTGVSSAQNNPNDITCQVELTDTTTVTATRLSSGINANVTVYFQVWEYVGASSGENEFVVHRFDAPMSGQNYFTGSDFGNFTASNANTPTWLPRDGFTHDSTGTEGNSMSVRLMGDVANIGSTLRSASASRSSSSEAGTIQFKGQVVEFTGSNWVVLHGFGDAGTESSPSEIFPEDDVGIYSTTGFSWARAFIQATKTLARVPDGTGGYLDDHDDANDQGLVVYPGDGDGDGDGDVSVFVAAQNNTYDETRHNVGVTVVYNTDSTFMAVEHLRSIQSGSESSLSAATTNDYTITDVGDLAYAASIAHAYTDNTSHDLAHAAYQAHLTSTTNLRLTRSQATGTGEFAAQIITFESAATVDLPHHSSSTTHHTIALATMPELPHHESSTTHHGLALPSAVAHRDTRYYASGTIATDLGQYATNMTASGVGGYEPSSARLNITGERNVYYRGDLSTADTNAVLVRHGDQTTVTTNTYGMAVSGTDEIQVLYGGTSLVSIDAGLSGTDQDFSIGWSTRANPLTTGASDAQVSELWIYNHDTGDRYFEKATHAAPSGSDGYTFSVAGWWNGSAMTGAPASAPSDVRVGTTFYPSVQYDEEFVSASPYTSAYAASTPVFPITRGSGLGSDGQYYGPQAGYVAHQIGRSTMRLASPLVNEIYRDSEVIYSAGSGLYTYDGTSRNRAIYAPGDQTTYQLISTYLRWVRVPLTYSRVFVRVNVSSYSTSGSDVPIGLACYSMERPPPWPTAWKRTVPVVATYSHSSRSNREWVDLGELQIVRQQSADSVWDSTTHLALALAIDPDGAVSNDSEARVYIHGWQVVPVGDPNADYSGPETPNQQLQPLPLGGLSAAMQLIGG